MMFPNNMNHPLPNVTTLAPTAFQPNGGYPVVDAAAAAAASATVPILGMHHHQNLTGSEYSSNTSSNTNPMQVPFSSPMGNLNEQQPQPQQQYLYATTTPMNIVSNNGNLNQSTSAATTAAVSSATENCNDENSNSANATKFEVPTIPDNMTPMLPHIPVKELPQRGQLYHGRGSNKECGRYGKLLRPFEEDCLKRAKKYAMEQSVKFVLVRQQQQQQRQQLDYIKKQQALLLMCRVYVGSIYYEVREDSVRQAFSPFGPIRSVSMTYDPVTNKHKGFAFIEYELPDAAQLALIQMNNAMLGGRNIKVGRPSNMPQAQPIINQLTEEAKNYNRVYVASVHPDLSEQDLRCVFEAFGRVHSCNLIKDSAGRHKGYGFIEYESHSSANDAIASMNLFDLGGQLLRVGRAITPPDGLLGNVPPPSSSSSLPTASAIAAANITAKLQALDVEVNPIGSMSMMNNQQMLDPHMSAAVQATAAPPGVLSTNQLNDYSMPLNDVSYYTMPINDISSTGISGNAFLPNNPTLIRNIAQAPPAVVQPVPPAIIIPPVSSPPATRATEENTAREQQTLELTDDQKKILGMIEDNSSSLQDEPTVKGREQRHMLMRKLMERQSESKVMILRNMVDADGVDSDLEADINEECSKYGTVKNVIISEECLSEEDTNSVVKIFVEFDTPKAVELAVEAINGRWFAGRVVKAESYEQSLYDAEDFTG